MSTAHRRRRGGPQERECSLGRAHWTPRAQGYRPLRGTATADTVLLPHLRVRRGVLGLAGAVCTQRAQRLHHCEPVQAEFYVIP